MVQPPHQKLCICHAQELRPVTCLYKAVLSRVEVLPQLLQVHSLGEPAVADPVSVLHAHQAIDEHLDLREAVSVYFVVAQVLTAIGLEHVGELPET